MHRPGEITPGLSLVVAVRDRVPWQMLRRWSGEDAVDAIVLVDFGSARPLVDDGVLTVPKVVVVRTGVDEPWARGLALNVGVAVASRSAILVLDGDAELRDIGAYRDSLASRGGFLTGYGADKGSASEILMMRREDWEAVGGFHEYLVGWGFEDEDLFNRLDDAGCRHRFFALGDFSAGNGTLPDVAAAETDLVLPDGLERHRWFRNNRNKILAGLAPWNAAMPGLRPRRFGRPSERAFTCELAPRTLIERRLQDCASYLAARFLHNVPESVAFPMLQRMIDERFADYPARAARQHQIDFAMRVRHGRLVRNG